MTLPIQVRMIGDSDQAPDRRVEAQQLVDTLRRRITETLKARIAFVTGHVYCFLCDAPECSHSGPRQAVDTFRGYRPTGKPEWKGFANLCMELREPRVDRLYGDDPEVIAVVQSGTKLTDTMMSGFGKGSLAYRVLGQVAFGLLPRNLDLRHPDERVTLTLMVVETRTGERAQQVQLNMVGLSMDDIAAAAGSARARGPAESLRRTIRTTRDRVASLARRAQDAEDRGSPLDLEGAVEPLLHRMKGDLERVFRPLRRRTKHAQERHQGGARPTGQALTDALGAPVERILRDVERDTVVVIGPKARAHVYAEDGRLVTSLQLRPNEVERKTERGRWRPMRASAVEAFRATLQAHSTR